MSSPLLSRAALVFLGYLAAVVVAVVVTVALWGTLASAFSAASPGTLLDELATACFMGAIVTFPTALPGFLVAIYLARKQRWTGWLRYTLAGTVNVIPALALFSLYTRMPSLIPTGLMLVCLPGGFAGGAAYWLVAGMHVRHGDAA